MSKSKKWARLRDDLDAGKDLVELLAYKTYGTAGGLFHKSRFYKYDIKFNTMGALMDFHLSASIFNFYPNRVPYVYDPKNLQLTFYPKFAHRADLELALLQSYGGHEKKVSAATQQEVKDAVESIKSSKPDNFVVMYSAYKALVDGQQNARVRTIRLPIGSLVAVAIILAINGIAQYFNVDFSLAEALGIGIGIGAGVSIAGLVKKSHNGTSAVRISFGSEQDASAFLKVLKDMKRWTFADRGTLPLISSGNAVTLVGCRPENRDLKRALESFRGSYARKDGIATDDEVYSALKSAIEDGNYSGLNRKLKSSIDRLPAPRRDELRTLILVNGGADADAQ